MARRLEMDMADHAALGFIGYIFGGVTAAVMLVGALVFTVNYPNAAQSPFVFEISAGQLVSSQVPAPALLR
jgi:hypothetical protein